MTEFTQTPIWPSLNATLNFLSTVGLLLGYIFVKSGKVKAHKIAMGFALLSSTAFLSCYLYYHYNYPPYPFQGQGIIRPIYFFILITHIILAVVMLPFIFNLVRHALAGRIEQHKKIARKVWPVWMYTSVTGILIYFMLYHWFNTNGAHVG